MNDVAVATRQLKLRNKRNLKSKYEVKGWWKSFDVETKPVSTDGTANRLITHA